MELACFLYNVMTSLKLLHMYTMSFSETVRNIDCFLKYGGSSVSMLLDIDDDHITNLQDSISFYKLK